MSHETLAPLVRTSNGELPYPLKGEHTRYTHLRGSRRPRTIIIHRPKYVISANGDGKVQVLTGRSLFIRDGKIMDVFDPRKKKIDLNLVDLIYDAGKRGGIAVTPGFVNAHAHPPMYMLRSSLMLEKGENLEKSLRDMHRFESKMEHDDFLISAMGDLTEEQKNGITTTLSHYAVFHPIDEAARVVKHNVVNAISAVSNSHPSNSPAMVEDLLKKRDAYTTRIAVAMHTLHAARPEVLREVARIVKKYRTIFTTHVAETSASVQLHRRIYHESPVATLRRFGLAHRRTILSHCVHVTEEDVKMIQRYGIGIVHLPTSNKLHRSGEFPFPFFAKYKAIHQVALGTDSVISKNSLDILSEALQARIMHQDKYVVFYEELFKMMTCNGADMLHMRDRGKILPGYRADLAFWKVRDRGFLPYDERNPVTLIGNMITHGGRNVRDLMINGQFVISNRTHNEINETQLLNALQERHQHLRRRMPKK